VFQSPRGRKIEVRGAVEAVDAPRSFRYLESYDFSPLKVQVTTTLDESGNNTRFTQTLVYGSQAERDADFHGIAASAEVMYPNLARYLQTISP
jgi:hypothetical protein